MAEKFGFITFLGRFEFYKLHQNLLAVENQRCKGSKVRCQPAHLGHIWDALESPVQNLHNLCRCQG